MKINFWKYEVVGILIFCIEKKLLFIKMIKEIIFKLKDAIEN